METEEDEYHSKVESLKSDIFDAQKEVKANLNNYDSHVKLISLLAELYSVYKSLECKAHDVTAAEEKTHVALNKLRNARKNMCSVFPLSVELWNNWIEDELNYTPRSIDDNVMYEIFEKATADYLSVDIWCHYIEFLIKRRDNTSSNVAKAKIREICEKAVTSCGLHYFDGHKIWELYKQFEQKILLEIEEKLVKEASAENIQSYEAQLLNLVKLFKRQMLVPLASHGELLERFTDTIDPYLKILKSHNPAIQLYKIEEIKSIHESTAEEINAKSIVAQEKHLEESQNSLEAYQSYICQELDSNKGDMARVQCLFERAIVYHCLKSSVWLDYIDFLNNVIKQPNLALSTSKRALRNVTWDARIYLKYVALFEHFSEVEEIRNAYEMGLEKYSDNGVNYCNVWMSYLSFEKRLCDSELLTIKNKVHIYELIQKALQHIETLPDSGKFVVEFMIFWINIETFWFDDKAKGEFILKYFGIKYRKDFAVWYQVVSFGRAMGYKCLVNELLDVYLQDCPDSFEQCDQIWLNFENIIGNVSSYNHLEKKINLFLPNRIQPHKTKESHGIKFKVNSQSKLLITWLNRAEKQLFSVEGVGNSLQLVSKLSKSETSPPKKDNGDGKKILGNDEKKNTVKRKHEDSPEVSECNSLLIGPSLPPGFLNSNDNQTKGSKDYSDDDDDHDQFMGPPKKVRLTEKTDKRENSSDLKRDEDERTVYVSNLHPATSESDLKIIFGRAGSVQKVDLHRLKGGKIFAFVTYSNPEEARIAFDLEHTPIRNRPVYVSKFNRTKDKHNIAPHYSQYQERNKLFVSNLDKSIMPNDLEKLFNRQGNMTSLRLINKKGSKPFAYVEYKTEAEAAKYRNEINYTILKGRQIFVEFSDPGKANQSDRHRQTTTGTSNFSRIEAKEKKSGETFRKDAMTNDRHKTETKSDVVQKGAKQASSNPFGFIPMQARNPRNQQPLNRKPKGPAVRLEVTPVSSSECKEDTSTLLDSTVSSDNKTLTTTNSKSNDYFRNMLLNK